MDEVKNAESERTKKDILRELLPAYRSHKIVYAAKILRTLPSEIEPDSVFLELEVEKDDAGPIHVQHLVSREWVKNRNAQEGGYYVLYADGYESWSPAKAFEEGYTRLEPVAPVTTGFAAPESMTVDRVAEAADLGPFTFGEAIERLKAGKRVARHGWNGKGMFIWLLPAGKIPKTAIYDPALRAVIDQHVEGDTFEALPSIRMWTRNAEGRWAVLTGWLASQTDMLSEDWYEVQ